MVQLLDVLFRYAAQSAHWLGVGHPFWWTTECAWTRAAGGEEAHGRENIPTLFNFLDVAWSLASPVTGIRHMCLAP